MKKKKQTNIVLDYHEGLSINQVKIILKELNLNYSDFARWIVGQTCPLIYRQHKKSLKQELVIGIYEYDLFRWIKNQKHGTPLIFD